MRILLLLPLLALFAAPWGLDRVSRVLASRSNPSPSASNAAAASPVAAAEESAASASDSSRAFSAAAPAAAAASAAPPVAEETPALPAAPAEAAPADSDDADDFVPRFEAEVFRLTNAQRAAHGLPALADDTRIHTIAWEHSADMLANGYFSHDSADGCSSSCRFTAAGYRWRAVGENIYMLSGYDLTPEDAAAMVVDGWMHSEGHRANILNGAFTETGAGVARRGSDIYVTADYAKPR